MREGRVEWLNESKRTFAGGDRLGNALGLCAWQQATGDGFWQGFAV